MFDEPPSLPMRAAVASLLGGLFGIGLILSTHSVQAQAPAGGVAIEARAEDPSTAIIRRIGEGPLLTVHVAEPALGSGSGSRGMRLGNDSADAGSGLRWQVARIKGLRSEGEIPRKRDLISVGVQVRY
jgi:hypothetical protein